MLMLVACAPSKPVPTSVGTYPVTTQTVPTPVVQQSQEDIEYQRWKAYNATHSTTGPDCDFDDWVERDTDCGFPAKVKTTKTAKKPVYKPAIKAVKPLPTTKPVSIAKAKPTPLKSSPKPYVAPVKVNAYGSSSYSKPSYSKPSVSVSKSSSSSSRRR